MTRRGLLFTLGAGGAWLTFVQRSIRPVITSDGRQSCEILYRLTGEFIF